MHSGVWSTGLTANSTDLTSTDGRLLFRITRGLNELPEVRGEDTIIPSLSGRVPRNRVNDRLIIEAEGYVMGSGVTESLQRADLRDLIDILRALMDPTQAPYAIEATVEDGSTRTIQARPVNIVWGPDDIPSYRTASLQWESVAPVWTPSGS